MARHTTWHARHSTAPHDPPGPVPADGRVCPGLWEGAHHTLAAPAEGARAAASSGFAAGRAFHAAAGRGEGLLHAGAGRGAGGGRLPATCGAAWGRSITEGHPVALLMEAGHCFQGASVLLSCAQRFSAAVVSGSRAAATSPRLPPSDTGHAPAAGVPPTPAGPGLARWWRCSRGQVHRRFHASQSLHACVNDGGRMGERDGRLLRTHLPPVVPQVADGSTDVGRLAAGRSALAQRTIGRRHQAARKFFAPQAVAFAGGMAALAAATAPAPHRAPTASASTPEWRMSNDCGIDSTNRLGCGADGVSKAPTTRSLCSDCSVS